MKPSLRHLMACPLALVLVASLGCDSDSSYGDRTNDPAADAEAQTPGWVTNVAVSKADITVTGMT